LNHPVRSVWRLSESLDLGFLADVSGGPSKLSPALIFSIWLWAAADGVGSARHIARLCEQHLVYRWLCGGISIDHQMLADVRAANQRRFDRLLSHCLAALVQEQILTTELMPIAPLDRSGPREQQAFVATASARVQQLRERDDPFADEYHMGAVATSAVQEQEERVTMALGWMKEVDRAPPKRRALGRLDKGHRRSTGPAIRRTKST